MGDGGVFGGAFDRDLPVFGVVFPGDLSAVGVGEDEGAAAFFDVLGEALDAVHAEDVLFHAPGEDVALVAGDFAAGDDNEADFFGDFGGFGFGPEGVVLGEADAVESGGFGAFGEVFGIEDGVV